MILGFVFFSSCKNEDEKNSSEGEVKNENSLAVNEDESPSGEFIKPSEDFKNNGPDEGELGKDEVMKVFIKINEDQRYDVNNEEHLPLIFKKGDKVFFAGIIRDSKIFTIRSLEDPETRKILASNYPVHMRNNSLESPEDAINKLVKNAKDLEEINRIVDENSSKRKANIENLVLDRKEIEKMISEITSSLRVARRKLVEKAVPDTLHTIDKSKDLEAYRAAFKKLLLDRKHFSEGLTMYRYKLKSYPDGYPADDPVKAKANAEKYAYSDEEQTLILIRDMLKPNSKDSVYGYHDAILKSKIKQEPMTYRPNDSGRQYVIAFLNAKEDVVALDISADLGMIETTAQKEEYRNGSKKTSDLTKLSAVSNIYTQYADAISLGESLE